MISILQKRKSILATPFTSDKKGVQMCCTVAIIALINPGIAAMPQITAKTSVFQETLLPSNKNWLECDVVRESLLHGVTSRKPQLSCTISAGPLLDGSSSRQSLLMCETSTSELLGMTLDIKPQLDADSSIEPLVSAEATIKPQLSAVITRPRCEE